LVPHSLDSAYLVVKISASIFKGTDAYTHSIQKINDAVGFYNSSIGDLGVALEMTVLDKVQELRDGLQSLAEKVENVQAGLQMFRQPFQAIAGTIHSIHGRVTGLM
jgi:hypothetical protein